MEKERGQSYRAVFIRHFKKISLKAEFVWFSFWQTAFEKYPEIFSEHDSKGISPFILSGHFFGTLHYALEKGLETSYPDVANAPLNVLLKRSVAQ